MKELRLQSGQPESNFRLAVAVDGVNALWGRSTIKKEDKSAVRKPISNLFLPHACVDASLSVSTDGKCCVSVFPHHHKVDPEELTLVYNLRKLMTNNWVKRALTALNTYLDEHIHFLSLTLSFFSQTGGAIITTLSQTGSLYSAKSAYLPQELLGEVSGHFYHFLLSLALAP